MSSRRPWFECLARVSKKRGKNEFTTQAAGNISENIINLGQVCL
jgi:hypothetical protein